MSTPKQATTLDEAYRTCNHLKPLESDDARYEDFSSARGDETARSIKARLIRHEPDEFVHIAFVSHRGAGKSTEIKRVSADLKHHFETYYFEANLQLDERHITAEDLLLTVAIGVDEFFEERGTPLPDEIVQEARGWFSERIRSTEWGKALEGTLLTEGAGGVEVPYFVKLKAELKALIRSESKYRTQVLDAFRRYPGTLVQYVNNLLDAANQALGDRQLLVVIDNLDRYDPKVVDELVFKNGRPLRSLHCHLIVTPPISLYYRPMSEPIQQAFHPEVMNTVRLRSPSQPYDQFDPESTGRAHLLAALQKRIDVARLIPDVRAQDRLISASGGAIRDLLRLVREAIILAPGAVLDLETIQRAVSRVRTEMRDRINANGWASVLARIMRDKQVHEGAACMDVLYQQLAFKYNGEGWYDVHPLVAELDEVTKALARLRAEDAAKPG